jgi:hypothetical protein
LEVDFSEVTGTDFGSKTSFEVSFLQFIKKKRTIKRK